MWNHHVLYMIWCLTSRPYRAFVIYFDSHVPLFYLHFIRVTLQYVVNEKQTLYRGNTVVISRVQYFLILCIFYIYFGTSLHTNKINHQNTHTHTHITRISFLHYAICKTFVLNYDQPLFYIMFVLFIGCVFFFQINCIVLFEKRNMHELYTKKKIHFDGSFIFCYYNYTTHTASIYV